jgi:hypothetical protein
LNFLSSHGAFLKHLSRVAAVLLLTSSLAAAGLRTKPDRGLWVWETAPLLSDAGERRTFFEFCKTHGINVVAMQIATRGTGADRQLDARAEWIALITEAHRGRMRVHALDGDPKFARAAQHGTVLSIVNAVVAYNASVAPAARFDGLHLDIEPQALPEWKDPKTREPLLAEYLEINQGAATRARAAGLLYGVDIPFWWHMPDDVTGEPIGIVTFRGERKLVTEHLLGFVDNIGIMAYRNVAAGPDGIIKLALDTIQRVERTRNVRAFVGIETEKVREGVPATITFAGKTLLDMREEIRVAEAALARYSSFLGIAIHRYGSLRVMAQAP